MDIEINHENLDGLQFGDNGLIPAVVQDCRTGRVLTLAYMNRDSLMLTLSEKRTVFWSRSRNEIWRKGETSGNVQHVVRVTADCDLDALLIEVDKDGPSCHLGNDSCFEFPVYDSGRPRRFSADGLYGLLESRKEEMPEGSYTSYLFKNGREKILKKISEECGEVVIASMKDARDEVVYELADLAYHCMVLMVEEGIEPDVLRDELASRHVVDVKLKQQTQKSVVR